MLYGDVKNADGEHAQELYVMCVGRISEAFASNQPMSEIVDTVLVSESVMERFSRENGIALGVSKTSRSAPQKTNESGANMPSM